MLIVALSLVAAAPAAGHGSSRRIRRLEHRLHNMTLARDQEKAIAAALAGRVESLTSQVQGLDGQVAGLEATVQQRTAERDAALSKAAALQARLDAIPTPLQVAVEQVRREVAYQEHGGLLPYSHGRLVAQAALDYVVGHVSASAYGWAEVFGGALPVPATADNVLGLQAGICGHAALTFAAIVKQFGLPVRSVQFWYTDPAPLSTPDSHIADEVFYDGGWHFFDATFGNYWASGQDVLSIDDARAGLGVEVKDDAAFTNLAENFVYGDSTGFETDPATTVVLDGQTFGG